MKTRLLILAITTLLSAGSAAALMPPQTYLTARAEAPRHVQVRIVAVSGPENDSMACGVTGHVVKRFRGDVKPGRVLKLKVDCNPPGGGFAGPQIFVSEAALRTARFAEVFLTGDEPPEVMRWQFHIIKKASKTPRCNAQEWACH
jgi:hypothetical protein